MKKFLITGVCLLALLVAMAGCDQGVTVEGPSIDSLTVKLVSAEATAQTDNETINLQQGGMGVQLEISVSNFNAVESIGGTDNVTGAVEGDGYYIYYLDRLPVSLQEEVPEFQPSDQTATDQQETTAWASTKTSITWDNLSPGMHIFSVQLVDVNGAPLTPAVVAAAALNVPAEVQEETPTTEETPATEETPTTEETPAT
jgi:hypothetical protein